MTIHVGDAFDVVCERKETDFKELSNNLYEFEYEITLRNHKESDVTVEVREPMSKVGDWEVEKSTCKSRSSTPPRLAFKFPSRRMGPRLSIIASA